MLYVWTDPMHVTQWYVPIDEGEPYESSHFARRHPDRLRPGRPGTGSHPGVWRLQLPQVSCFGAIGRFAAQHFTVINYDRRGRGDGGDTRPYAIEREIEDIQALIATAGGEAFVWGLSSGAILALKAAAIGLAITKLALQEPPLFVTATDRQPPKDLTTHLTDLIASDRRDDAVKYFMTEGMGAPGFVIPLMHLMPGAWPKLKAVAHTLPYDAKLLEGYTAGKPLSGNDWGLVTMSTLVMAGSESPAFLRHDAQALAGALPHARLLTQKGLGHTRQLSPKLIASVLIEFFEGE